MKHQTTPIYAWYFSDKSERLRFGDGRKVELGKTHKVEGELRLYAHGLHASKRLIDALSYAPSETLWLVELSGEILDSTDKCVASERKYIARLNSEKILRDFARECVLSVIDLRDAPQVVIDYLKTGNEEIRDAARDAASASALAAARAAAWDAALAAARDAAWAVASASALAAARDVVCDAAWDAVCDAAWDAAFAAKMEEFNKLLTQKVIDAIELPEGA